MLRQNPLQVQAGSVAHQQGVTGWQQHKVAIVVAGVAVLVGAFVVAGRTHPCITTRRGNHKGTEYRVRTCWNGIGYKKSLVVHRASVLVDGTWISTYEFWNVNTDGGWKSASSLEEYVINLIDDAIAGRQYPDGRGEPPSSPHYFEYDPEALARSKRWKAQFGHT